MSAKASGRLRILVAVLAVLCLVGAGLLISGATPRSLLRWLGVDRDRCGGADGCFAFYAVGCGDCCALYTETAAGLIDTGNPEYAPAVAKRLRALRIDTLDFMVISHPHTDHIGGAVFLMDALQVKTIYIRAYDPDDYEDLSGYRALLAHAGERGVTVVTVTDGMAVQYGGIRLTFYAPPFFSMDENEKCLLTMAQTGDVRCLFTGDAGELTETVLCQRGYDLRAEWLKVGHHGSKGGTTDAFLDAVSPEAAAICVGPNPYGHPSDEVIDRLRAHQVDFYRTDGCKQIVVAIRQKTWNVTIK